VSWYFPLIPAILIAILFWATRETLRAGRVEKMGMVVRRSEKPVTFWAFVVTQWSWIAMMLIVLGMWGADFNGLRTG
jgi:hypothetical protein